MSTPENICFNQRSMRGLDACRIGRRVEQLECPDRHHVAEARIDGNPRSRFGMVKKWEEAKSTMATIWCFAIDQ
jgi:hypothetical protein